jgi:hypothetical protein
MAALPSTRGEIFVRSRRGSHAFLQSANCKKNIVNGTGKPLTYQGNRSRRLQIAIPALFVVQIDDKIGSANERNLLADHNKLPEGLHF